MSVLLGADWYPWRLGTYFPQDCGGHSYIYHPGQLGDTKRLAEKARRSSGQWQVVHHHEPGQRCDDTCEAYGLPGEVPQPARQTEVP